LVNTAPRAGAGALAALGLSILPYRRTQLKAELAHGVATLQSRLREQMVDAFETFMRQHTVRGKADTAVCVDKFLFPPTYILCMGEILLKR
jgi:hypothetical protein